MKWVIISCESKCKLFALKIGGCKLKLKLFNKIIIFTIILISLLSGCSNEKYIEESTGKLKVYASFYPIYFAAEQIGREKIELYTVIPNGAEPHDYEPSLREIADVENADVFIFNGVNMEPWAEKLSNNLASKGIKTINLSQYVDLIKTDEEEEDDDEHDGHHTDHIHGVYDPHIWLDPLNMDKIAYQIMTVFSELDSKNQDFYKRNYEDFAGKIRELDQAFSSELKNRSRNTILVSHKAFGYLAKRYGLEQVPVTGITPHEEPSPKTLARLIDKIEEEKFEYIFLETLASPKVVETLSKSGNLKVLELNPVAGLTEEQQKNNENYFTLMEKNLENLKKALVK